MGAGQGPSGLNRISPGLRLAGLTLATQGGSSPGGVVARLPTELRFAVGASWAGAYWLGKLARRDLGYPRVRSKRRTGRPYLAGRAGRAGPSGQTYAGILGSATADGWLTRRFISIRNPIPVKI